LHEVRFLIGDIVVTSQQLSNEDIAYILTRNENDVRKSAWKAAEQMVAIYAQRANISAGPIQVYNGQKFNQWKELADRLKQEYLHPNGAGYVLSDISAGAMANPDALGDTVLGGGDWHTILTRTGTGGGTLP